MRELKEAGEVPGHIGSFAQLAAAMEREDGCVVSPATGKEFVYAESRADGDFSVLTKKEMDRYLGLEAKVNLNRVRELLLAIKQNNLTDHQKRGLLLAHHRITKPEVIEEIVKWDAGMITSERVALFMGQESIEIRSIERGGIVSSAMRGGVVLHRLADGKWNAVLAQTTVHRIQGETGKKTMVNLREEYAQKGGTYHAEMLKALDRLIENLPDDDESLANLDMFVLGSSGQDGGLELVRDYVPFQGELVTPAEATQMVVDKITQSLKNRFEVEATSEAVGQFLGDILHVDEIEDLVADMKFSDPLFEQIYDRIEELSEETQERLRELKANADQSTDDPMGQDEIAESRRARIVAAAVCRSQGPAGQGSTGVPGLYPSFNKWSALKHDPDFERRQAEKAAAEQQRVHEERRRQSGDIRQRGSQNARQQAPSRLKREGADGKHRTPKAYGGIGSFAGLDFFQGHDPTLASLGIESMKVAKRKEMLVSAFTQGQYQDPARARSIALNLAEKVLALDRRTGKMIRPKEQRSEDFKDGVALRGVQMVVSRRDSPFLHGGSVATESRRLEDDEKQHSAITGALLEGRSPINNDPQTALQDECSYDQPAYEQSFKVLQPYPVREWLYLANQYAMLPNGVVLVGIDWAEPKCRVPAFPHGIGGQKTTNKVNFERAMAASAKRLPPNFIHWDDMERYEVDFGYRVVDVWEKACVPRGFAQSLKVRYVPEDFQDDNYKKTVYRHLPVEADASASISKMSDLAQQRLIEETFRVEVMHFVEPENAADGETDYDRAGDVA